MALGVKGMSNLGIWYSCLTLFKYFIINFKFLIAQHSWGMFFVFRLLYTQGCLCFGTVHCLSLPFQENAFLGSQHPLPLLLRQTMSSLTQTHCVIKNGAGWGGCSFLAHLHLAWYGFICRWRTGYGFLYNSLQPEETGNGASQGKLNWGYRSLALAPQSPVLEGSGSSLLQSGTYKLSFATGWHSKGF